MSLNLANTLESGLANGTPLTQGVGGNTGGSAGNFFDTVTIGSGAVVQFSSSAARGALALHCSTGGSAAIAGVFWGAPGGGGSVPTPLPIAYGRATIRPNSIGALMPWHRGRSGAVPTQNFRLTVNAAGKIELRNTSSGVVVTSTGIMTISVYWLIRWMITISASTTAYVVYIHYTPTSATPDETLTGTAANFFTGSVDTFDFGLGASTASGDINLDDLVVTDQGVPGPPSQSITVSDSAAGSDSLGRALVLPRALADAAAGTDGLGRQLIAARAAADSANGTDGITRALILPRSVSDPAAGSDGTVRTLLVARSITDAAAGIDTTVRALILPRGLTDQAAGTDAANRATNSPRATTDTANGTDAPTQTSIHPRTLADSAAGDAAVSRAAVAVRTVVDSAAGADGITRTTATGRPVSDTAAGSDGPAATVVYSRAVADAAAGEDTVTATVISAASERSLVFTFGPPTGKYVFGDPVESLFVFGDPIG